MNSDVLFINSNQISTKPVFSNLQCKKKDLLMILQCQYESDVSYCQPFDNVEVHCSKLSLNH